MLLRRGKKGQLSIFIIVALVIAGLVGGYFLVKNLGVISRTPAAFTEVESYYLSCIDENVKSGIAILEQQGGFIYLPEFAPGSQYMPSSNMLDFMGSGIPYWFYISGNNVINENIPTKDSMEAELEKYLDDNVVCDFSSFIEKGYDIETGEVKSKVEIADGKVKASVNSNLYIYFQNQSVNIIEHKTEVSSKLREFYNEAMRIYNKEKTETFLEKYVLDVLYLYAPVNGVELSCSPKIWSYSEVQNDIKEALEENMGMLKVKGNYYRINSKMKYFVVDVPSSNAVRFSYSTEWPTKIEADDSDGILMAEPVGNQPGMGIIGFCYTPYHFVYNVVYPVLIQIYDEKEIFQFPVSVIIKDNKEREAIPGTYYGEAMPEICRDKNADVVVKTYNSKLDAVEADISFKCFNQLCSIGKTKLEGEEAVLSAKFPQCVNGFILASSEGYEEAKKMISTNNEGYADIILDRIYNLSLSVKVDGRETGDLAVVYFIGQERMKVAAWPEQKTAGLAEGLYNISVFVYKNSSISIPGSNEQKCVTMAKPGLMGVFGGTEEKCFDMNIPSQSVSNIVYAGGKSQEYLTETQLEKGKLEINVKSIAIPKSLDELQDSYITIENNRVEIE
ncbi:hypothetical protein HYW76_04240 [Candidatus Pacearchaeota archaeon]|nr:hypothetical protein [Candidatus Pacearchaeota archaeon]